jgi:hypothetical protein
MGIVKVIFGQRMCQPIHMEEATMLFVKEFCGAVEDIVIGGCPFFGDLQWRLDSLPIRFGGARFVLSSRHLLVHFCDF